MKHNDEAMLKNAIQALQATEPDAETISASAGRVASRLGISMNDNRPIAAIENCGDVRGLLGGYRAGSLSDARSLLVEAHLRDCGACLRYFRSESGSGAVDWSVPKIAPKQARAFPWRPRALGWALACTVGIAACSVLLYRMYFEVPPGVRAEVQSIDGSAYLVSDAGDRRLLPGANLQEGQHLRTGGGSRAVLRLADGSTIEVNERSVLGVGARGHNVTVSLDDGAVIVQAAKRTSGHLYVRTPDCRVAVTGTVFSVDSGIKGSRVAVLQGNVQVMHSGMETLLHAGDQIATNDNLSPAPLEQEVAWSQDREKYLGLVAEFAVLGHRIGQIPLPQSRYSSDLLNRVPAGTLLYVSFPNLGDFLSEANTIFHDQLNQSPALQQWWSSGHSNNTAELDALIEKLHDVSQYLGDEVVVVGVKQADRPTFAILADLQRSGLDDLLRKQFSASMPKGGLTVFDERTLSAASDSSKTERGGYALVREHEAVFSNSIATLKELSAQLNAGASGFAAGDFGKQIAAAYDRGAGIILAADLHQMLSERASLHRGSPTGNAVMENSGLEGVEYLIAEHRETNGVPANHLNLEFSGARQRVASWLASPAPIESLDFVSPNAALTVAGLTKDPTAIADDMIAMTSVRGEREEEASETETEFRTIVRDDLVPNLGGEFLLALDGPVLPTPSWKAVIEVHDAGRIESALEQLTQLFDNQPHGKDFHPVQIQSTEVGVQRYYAVSDRASGSIVAQYTFSGGFMIVAPNRALLIEALRTRASGDSLSRSEAFKTLLPKDDNENCSAVAYQNLGPVLTPLLSQVKGESADAIRKLAEDSRPTAICAWGKESRIEAASDSHLFGFDLLTLGALLDSRNKFNGQHVRE
jgi:hypothetical protein